MSTYNEDPPPSPFGNASHDDDHDDDHDDGDMELAESSVAMITPNTGYSDDADEIREMHRSSPYLSDRSFMTCMKYTGCVLGLLAVLTTGYFLGKSSNEKVDAVMGKIPGSGTFAASKSSPEADFASAKKVKSPKTEEDRMELLRASIGKSTLTLDDVIKESAEWDESEIPNFESTIDISQLSDTDKLLFTFLAKYPFARDFVVELVIDDYTNPESSAYQGVAGEVYSRLDYALEAMELYEVDYEPVMIKGHPFLYVGSVGASFTYGSLVKAGITHIVDLSTAAKCNQFKDDFEYLCLEDGFHNDDESLEKLDHGVEFVEHVRKNGGKVMSHDWYGTTNSCTLLVGWLMKYEGMGVKEGTTLIQKTRPMAQPYVHVLEKYGKKYLSRANPPDAH